MLEGSSKIIILEYTRGSEFKTLPLFFRRRKRGLRDRGFCAIFKTIYENMKNFKRKPRSSDIVSGRFLLKV